MKPPAHRIRRILLLAAALGFLCLALHGCGGGGDGASHRREMERARQMIERERLAAQEARLSRRNWQLAASFLGTAAVVALLVGTAMGSKARRDAEGRGDGHAR